MAYKKQNFKDGTILSASHLNKIEEGLSTFRTINGKDIQTIGGIEIPNARFYQDSEQYYEYSCLDTLWTPKNGYYYGIGGWAASSIYTSWYFTVTDETMTSLYLSNVPEEVSNSAYYFSLCRVRDGSTIRWRNYSDDTLKDIAGEENAIDIQVDDMIVLSATSVSVAMAVGINIYGLVKFYETEAEYSWKTITISDSIWEDIQTGYYWTQSGWSALSNWKGQQFTLPDDTYKKIYLSFNNNTGKPSSVAQLVINRGGAYMRWRSDYGEGVDGIGLIPYSKKNAIELLPNDVVTISWINYSTNEPILYLAYEAEEEEETSSGSAASCYVNYNTGTEGGVTELLNIYLPQSDGYALWRFVHSDVDDSYCHTWRIGDVWSATSSFSTVRQLTVMGAEWEMAVRLAGRPDFIGGYAHGDEIYNSAVFFVDGAYVSDLSSLSTRKAFTELRIVVCSTGYDPNDHETEALTHQKELVFTKNGVTVTQNVIWLNDYDITACYLAMMPPRKVSADDLEYNITDAYYTDTDMSFNLYTDTESNGYSITYKTPVPTSLHTYSTINGYHFTMSIPKYVTTKNGYYGLLTDNGSSNYHKMYFSIAQNDVVTVGERWDSITVYNVQC